MDNARQTSPARSWSPARGLVVAAWLATAAALGWLVLTDDPPGRLFAAVATAVLAAAALFGTFARPRLSVDEQRIAVRGLTGTRTWPWRQVHRVRVARHRRLGREVALLEIDVVDGEQGERLILLGRLDLDADPDEVLETIYQVRGLA